MIEIIQATTKPDYILIEQLADVIWRQHYIPLVGKPQIDYMLDKFQSVEAISKQIENDGYEYYVLTFDETPAGYIGFKKEADHVFLSKIYVLSDFRGKKIGKAAIQFIQEQAKRNQLKAIRLGVNIHNTNSIKAYEKLGFKTVNTFVTDIGNGFVMDDFIMEKEV